MKKIMFFMVTLLMAGMTLQSCQDTDKRIKDDVDNALKARYSAVSTSVNDKVVTLTGTLESQTERSSAESVARSVKDVKSVVNNIMVNEPTPTVRVDTDGTIRTSLENQLRTAGHNDVKVEVMNNGEVVLSGEVKRADLQKVMQMANETPNVTKVTNNITLK